MIYNINIYKNRYTLFTQYTIVNERTRNITFTLKFQGPSVIIYNHEYCINFDHLCISKFF